MSEGTGKEEIGIKNDGGKLLAGLVIQDFGLALLQVSGVGTYGAGKYAPKNWLLVEEGERRYLNALMRHLLLSETEEIDPETGLSHLSHVAWNILAVVELRERRKKEVAVEFDPPIKVEEELSPIILTNEEAQALLKETYADEDEGKEGLYPPPLENKIDKILDWIKFHGEEIKCKGEKCKITEEMAFSFPCKMED